MCKVKASLICSLCHENFRLMDEVVINACGHCFCKKSCVPFSHACVVCGEYGFVELGVMVDVDEDCCNDGWFELIQAKKVCGDCGTGFINYWQQITSIAKVNEEGKAICLACAGED